MTLRCARILKGSLAVMLLGLALEAQVPGPGTAPARPLAVGLDADYFPFEFADAKGQAGGFTVDLLQAIARDEGLALEFHPGAWADVRKGLREGRIDLLAGMLRSPLREETHELSSPHLQMDYGLFTRKEGPLLGGLEAPRGRKVLLQEATYIHEYLLAQGHGTNLKPALSERDALIRLAAGEADAAVVTQPGGNALIREHRLLNLQARSLPVQDLDYCFAISRSRQDLARMGLMARLNRGLAHLHASGEYNRIYRRWFGAGDQESLSRALRITAWIALPLLALLGLVLVWNATLRRLVSARTRELQHHQEHLEELVQTRTADLQKALEDVKRLSGLLPICASCKKVRNDDGFWTQAEQYIEDHSEAHFTHGICPECIKSLYPGLGPDRNSKGGPAT